MPKRARVTASAVQGLENIYTFILWQTIFQYNIIENHPISLSDNSIIIS